MDALENALEDRCSVPCPFPIFLPAGWPAGKVAGVMPLGMEVTQDGVTRWKLCFVEQSLICSRPDFYLREKQTSVSFRHSDFGSPLLVAKLSFLLVCECDSGCVWVHVSECAGTCVCWGNEGWRIWEWKNIDIRTNERLLLQSLTPLEKIIWV